MIGNTVRLSTVGLDKLRQSCHNPGILPISHVSLTLFNFINCQLWANLLITLSCCQKALSEKIPTELSAFTRGPTIIDFHIWATESRGEITWGKMRVWACPLGNNSNGNRLNGLIRTNGAEQGCSGAVVQSESSGWLHSPPELSSCQYRRSFIIVLFFFVFLLGFIWWH